MDSLIHHMLHTSANRAPEKEALVHGQRRLSYGEVAGLTRGLGAGLQGAGIARGDRVGIYLEASVAQVLSIFAISQAGGVFVPINAQLFPGAGCPHRQRLRNEGFDHEIRRSSRRCAICCRRFLL